MNTIVGDNRLENVAVRPSDRKVREAYVAENEQVQNTPDEQTKKVEDDGVILELDKTEENVSNAERTKALERVQNSTENQEQEKAERLEAQNEERKVAEAQRILENINI